MILWSCSFNHACRSHKEGTQGPRCLVRRLFQGRHLVNTCGTNLIKERMLVTLFLGKVVPNARGCSAHSPSPLRSDILPLAFSCKCGAAPTQPLSIRKREL